MKKNTRKAAVAGAAISLLAMASYQVRELAAALVLFSVAFCIVGAAVLLLILLDTAAAQGLHSLRHAHVSHVVAMSRSVRSSRESLGHYYSNRRA